MLPNNPTPSDVHQAIRNLEAGTGGGAGGGDIKTFVAAGSFGGFTGEIDLMEINGMQEMYLNNAVVIIATVMEQGGDVVSITLVPSQSSWETAPVWKGLAPLIFVGDVIYLEYNPGSHTITSSYWQAELCGVTVFYRA